MCPAASRVTTPTTLHCLQELLTAESYTRFRVQKRSLRLPRWAPLDRSEVQWAPGNFLSVRGKIRLQMYTDVSHDTDRKWRITFMSAVGQETTADYTAQVMVKETFFKLALMCWAQTGTHKILKHTGFQHNCKDRFLYTPQNTHPSWILTGSEYRYRVTCDNKNTISNCVTSVAWVWRAKINNKKKNTTFVISVRDLVKTNFLR